LPLCKDASAVEIEFNGADAPMSAEHAAQYASANASE
jgi:hypothetical protein